MPCYDSRDDEYAARNNQLAAVLCGVLTVHGVGILNTLDWKEIGVDREIVARWWKEHLKEDERRRDREAQQRRQQKLADNAIKKLTTAELNALLKKR